MKIPTGRLRAASLVALSVVVAFAAWGPARADVTLPLVSGDKVSGRLDPAGEVERYEIDCPASAVLTLSVVATKVAPAKAASPLRVRVLDGDGNVLAFLDRGVERSADASGTKVRLRGVVLPATGRYTVVVAAADGAADDGAAAPIAYSMTVAWKPASKWSVRGVSVGAGVPGALPFSAPSGALVRFAAKRSGAVLPTFGRILEDDAPTGTDLTGLSPRAARFTAPHLGDFVAEIVTDADALVDATATVTPVRAKARKIDVTSVPGGGGDGDGRVVLFDGVSPISIAAAATQIEGARLDIPGGAFPAGTVLYLGPAGAVVPAVGFAQAGPAVEITASRRFNSGATVTLTLPFDATKARGSAANVAVTIEDSAGAISTLTTGLTVDLGMGIVSFPATHFSRYQVSTVAPSGTITTVAGDGGFTFTGDGVPATTTSVSNPRGIAVDGEGNLYIADIADDRIRRVDALGIITTVAGTGTGGFAGDGGPATAAQLSFPNAVAFAPGGGYYIADRLNHRIRFVDAAGTISTVAGDGNATFAGDGGPATSASLRHPIGVATDPAGNLFIAEYFSHRVRRVTPAGTISTVAGDGTNGFGGDGGAATAASLSYPGAVIVDASGNLVIADEGNSRIRRIDAQTGSITTIAGDGVERYAGDGGPATAASLYYPHGLALDAAGNLYVAEIFNHVVRKITPGGTISTIAGDGGQQFSGDDGPATAASFSEPYGVAVDVAGTIFIADSGNSRIRRVVR